MLSCQFRLLGTVGLGHPQRQASQTGNKYFNKYNIQLEQETKLQMPDFKLMIIIF